MTPASAAGATLAAYLHPPGASRFYAGPAEIPGLSFTIRDGDIVRFRHWEGGDLEDRGRIHIRCRRNALVMFYPATAGGAKEVL